LVSIGYNPNSNNNLNNINLDSNDDGMIIGDFYKKYGDILPQKQHREQHRTPVPRKPVQVDKTLGVKLCEYCSNYVDNLYKHYSECQAKRLIEAENRNYKNNLKNLTKKVRW